MEPIYLSIEWVVFRLNFSRSVSNSDYFVEISKVLVQCNCTVCIFLCVVVLLFLLFFFSEGRRW